MSISNKERNNFDTRYQDQMKETVIADNYNKSKSTFNAFVKNKCKRRNTIKKIKR